MADDRDSRWWWWEALGELDGERAVRGLLGDGKSRHNPKELLQYEPLPNALASKDPWYIHEVLTYWFGEYPEALSAKEHEDSFAPRAFLFGKGTKGHEDEGDALEAYNYGFLNGMIDYVIAKHRWPEWKQRHKFII